MRTALTVMTCLLAFLQGAARAAQANAAGDYALLTVHLDTAVVRQRDAAGRVLEFVDVLGRRNRCSYGADGLLHTIRFPTARGEATIRFLYTRLGMLTTVVLEDHTAVSFRGGKMQPAAARASSAELYAEALERWLAKKNGGK